jgi:hypothetical protein
MDDFDKKNERTFTDEVIVFVVGIIVCGVTYFLPSSLPMLELWRYQWRLEWLTKLRSYQSRTRS